MTVPKPNKVYFRVTKVSISPSIVATFPLALRSMRDVPQRRCALRIVSAYGNDKKQEKVVG